MRTTTTRWIPPHDPRAADRRSRQAGSDLRLTSEGPQKLVAKALGVSTARASQMIRGDHTGVTARLYEAIDASVAAARRNRRINPGAILAGALVHLSDAMTDWSDVDLVQWIREAARWETVTEAREDVNEMDLLIALERMDHDPAGLRDVLQRWSDDSMRELGWTVAMLAAGRELGRRMEALYA